MYRSFHQFHECENRKIDPLVLVLEHLMPPLQVPLLHLLLLLREVFDHSLFLHILVWVFLLLFNENNHNEHKYIYKSKNLSIKPYSKGPVFSMGNWI